MSELIKIAVDAMGGDGSPKKVIDGIIQNHKKNKENYFKIFGNQDEIINLIDNKITKDYFEIVHTKNIVKSTDTPLEGAKRVKIQVCGLLLKVLKKKKLTL